MEHRVPIPWPRSPPVSSVSTESAFLARPPLPLDLLCPLPPALLILLNCCLIIASPSPGHSPGNITWHGTGSLCLHIGICVGYNLESHVAEISDIFSCIPHQIFTLHVQCTHCQFEQVMHNTYKSSLSADGSFAALLIVYLFPSCCKPRHQFTSLA